MSAIFKVGDLVDWKAAVVDRPPATVESVRDDGFVRVSWPQHRGGTCHFWVKGTFLTLVGLGGLEGGEG